MEETRVTNVLRWGLAGLVAWTAGANGKIVFEPGTEPKMTVLYVERFEVTAVENGSNGHPLPMPLGIITAASSAAAIAPEMP